MSPDRIRLLLGHDDEEVREAAVEYFSTGYNPVQVAQADVFRLMDERGIKEAEWLFGRFSQLLPSDDAPRRLKELACSDDVLPSVLHAIATLDRDLTAEWIAASGASRLHPHVRELLTTRERLKGCSTRELWHMHEKVFVDHEKSGGRFSGTPRFEALRAALRASAHEASTLALATIRDASCFWECDDRPAPEEEAAFSCLMEMPHPDALPLLVSRPKSNDHLST